MSKPRVFKDYNKLSPEVKSLINSNFPFGFERKIVRFTDPKGKLVSALPFETDEFSYLIKMNNAMMLQEQEEAGPEEETMDLEEISEEEIKKGNKK